MKKHRLIRLCTQLVVCACTLCSAALASTNGVAGHLTVKSSNSDNTAKTELVPVSEQQDEYEFGLAGNYRNEWMNFTSAYNVLDYRYSKDTQPSYTEVDGTTSLLFGGNADIANLLLSHSRRSMLNRPDAIDVNSNRDTRSISRVQPSLNLHLTSADELNLRASASQVDYRFQDYMNSKQKGVDVIWQRGISATDQFQLSAAQSKTTFTMSPASDYEYKNAALGYNVTLRKLSYSAQVGVNQATTIATHNTHSSPSYNFTANYLVAKNKFGFSASQKISDTSQGDGNQARLSGNSQLSTSAGIDLVNLKIIQVSWVGDFICERCSLGANAERQIEDYQELTGDNKETRFNIFASYKFTRKFSVQLSSSDAKRAFGPEVSLEGYDVMNNRVSFTYDPRADLGIQMYVEQEHRKSTGGRSEYQEHITGASLSYRF